MVIPDCNEQLSHSNLFNQRKQRVFIPDTRKDLTYWDRRRKNNAAAKKSRVKRKFNDLLLETKVAELEKENALLREQLRAVYEQNDVTKRTGEIIFWTTFILITILS